MNVAYDIRLCYVMNFGIADFWCINGIISLKFAKYAF